MTDQETTAETSPSQEETKKREIRFWPHIVLTQLGLFVVVTGLIVVMAILYPVPDDAPMEIPLPDEGAGVPGPEWLFMLFWIAFWYFKGTMKKYLFLGSVVPLALGLFLILLPYLHKIPFRRLPGLGSFLGKIARLPGSRKKSFLYAIPPLVLALILSLGVWGSGKDAKVYGCDSCHNPAMGHRMAIPPANVARYYRVERAMQISVGKYRAGKSTGQDAVGEMIYGKEETEGYKDANWQMRHMYEPTFTW